jgi:hypothetical protein
MNLQAAITQKFGRAGLVAAKNSPHFLFGAGIVGFVGTTVLACRATLKLEEVLAETQTDLAVARGIDDERYSESDRQKDVTLIQVRAAGEVAKLYAPAVIAGAISIVALTKSHNILNERVAGLTAAYAAVDKAFREYRQRVVDKYGEEEDRNFRYDTEEVEVTNEKTGKKATVRRVGPRGASQYARFFDELAQDWNRDPELNLYYLKCQQNYLNDLLRARGHVFLNEVYDRIGVPRSKAGAVVGWVMTNDGSTDNYIDFGIFDGEDNHKVRDFVNGREGAILLDFNVDGVIYDKIEQDPAAEDIRWQLEN